MALAEPLTRFGRRALCVVCAVALAASAAAAATADGDPASDYLVAQDTFTPYPPPAASAVTALVGAVAAVRAHRARVKVAVIAGPQDLGSVTSLFGQPETYARFLSEELLFVYHGPLLVVMPAGFGFVRDTRPDAAALQLIAGTETGSDPTTLTNAAAAAVRALDRGGALSVSDTTKPAAFVQPQHAYRGRRVFLRYGVSDDSGVARADLSVRTAGGATIKTFRGGFSSAVPGDTHGFVWRVPRTAPARLSVCVRATDRAGNRSALACARLTIS